MWAVLGEGANGVHPATVSHEHLANGGIGRFAICRAVHGSVEGIRALHCGRTCPRVGELESSVTVMELAKAVGVRLKSSLIVIPIA